jgi:hypothetical protein
MGSGRKMGSGSAARTGKSMGYVGDEKALRYATPFLNWDLDLDVHMGLQGKNAGANKYIG